MKASFRFLAALLCSGAMLGPSAFAQLNVPSDGSDGALIVTTVNSTNTIIDLSQATTGVYTANNAGNAGNGIYDTNQWAVVFKYSSVNIAAGATVTFINHPTHAPVVWLVQSNVVINGIVNLNGQSGSTAFPQAYEPSEPGPGGFRGGAYGPLGQGDGYGPGASESLGYYDAGYLGIYGNPQILPLIGGSGEGGGLDQGSGGAGGGSILIVAGSSVTVNGQVTVYGARDGGNADYGGSSGAVRIVANQVLGDGTVDASSAFGGVFSEGRTRIEANMLAPTLNIFPNAVAVPPGTTPVIFPAANAPNVWIVSVDSQPAPANPLAAVASSSDVGIQNTNAVNVILQTKNFPVQGVVSLRVTPKYGRFYTVNAGYISGDINSATWQASAVLPQGFCVLQARATAP